MKKTIILSICAFSVLILVSCNDAVKQEAPAAVTTAEPVKPVVVESAKPDMAQIRSEIVVIENAWADATNKKDVNALMALYADDAQSMQDGAPTLVGKAAIQKQTEKDFAGERKFASIAFETTDVYAQGDFVTETGKTFYKDAAGKVTGSGKYMVVYEKKNGKYLCVREIYNKDNK